jgi:hypothetical protein
MERIVDSATYLAENMHRVPVLVMPCIESRPGQRDSGEMAGLYGSIRKARKKPDF